MFGDHWVQRGIILHPDGGIRADQKEIASDLQRLKSPPKLQPLGVPAFVKATERLGVEG